MNQKYPSWKCFWSRTR